MLQNEKTWPAFVKAAIIGIKGGEQEPTVGKYTAFAGGKFIRDGLFDDHGLTHRDGKWHAKVGETEKIVDPDKPFFSINDVRQSFGELLTDLLTNGSKLGFLSNASAAAKSAGYKAEDKPKPTSAEIDALVND